MPVIIMGAYTYRSPQMLTPRFLEDCEPPRLLTSATTGVLRSPPARRARRAKPPSLAQHGSCWRPSTSPPLSFLDTRTPDIERDDLCSAGVVFDLVAQDEAGAGVAGAGGVELIAQGGEGSGAPGRGERVEPHSQDAVAGGDVAAGGGGFADHGGGFGARAGAGAVQGAGRHGLCVELSHP